MNYEPLLKNLPPLIGLVVLVLVLLFVLVNFGYLRACDIPGFSGIYYSIKGTPRVAIVSGTDGTGNADKFRAIVAQEVHMAPAVIPMNVVLDSSALSNYQIVIVEHAKTISTQTLWAFQKYVQAGGKLVWIGDAGTKLGSNDYICEKVAFTYKLGYDTQIGPNQTQEQCIERTEEPNTLDNSDDGLCGKTFGDIVMAFIEQNRTIYESTSMGTYHLCRSEREPYTLSNAENILSCITELSNDGKEINAANVNEFCGGYNYWKRGPSKTATGDPVNSVDFSQLVLGVDFVKQYGASNLFMTPSGGAHTLTSGYETGTSVDFTQYYGVSNVSIVDASRFSSLPRTSTIMAMQIGETTYPMIVVSSPYVQINRAGLIVYYAFAPDDLIKMEQGGYQGPGLRLFNNLFKFLMC